MSQSTYKWVVTCQYVVINPLVLSFAVDNNRAMLTMHVTDIYVNDQEIRNLSSYIIFEEHHIKNISYLNQRVRPLV